ncbi:MAG: hemolysin family protein [Candidatus Cloacimonetes bacterium]|nr:hemolysin family protein [Candidatus Cloacimonadota bacterium]
MEYTGDFLMLFSLIILSAFFSASETAFFSLNKIQVKKMEKSKSISARRVQRLYNKPLRLLTTILLGNTVVNIALSAIGALLTLKLFEGTISTSLLLLIEVILMTCFILVFGEILPKLFAYSANERFSEFAAFFLEFIMYLLFPLILIIELITKTISKNQIEGSFSRITSEDFKSFIISEVENYKLEENEERIIKGILNLPSIQVKEIMVPRVDMIAVAGNESLPNLKKLFKQYGYSRIPVYNDSIDDIIGIIYGKDIILKSKIDSITSLMRKPYFIPENTKIQELMNHFKIKKTHIAIVVDEYGGTSGLVTLEDILEQLVGEIEDEYDNEEPILTKISENNYSINGMMSIYDFNQQFDTNIEQEAYDNIADFLLDKFDKFPDENSKLEYENNLIFVITKIENQRIMRINLKIRK